MGRLLLGAAVLGMCVLTASAADTDALLKDLKAKNAKTRQKAAEALAAVTPDDSVTTAICDAALDPSADVAAAALKSLEKMRPDLYKPMVTLLIDKAQSARSSAAVDLGKLGEKAKPAVRAMTGIAKRDIQLYLAPKSSGPRNLDDVIEATLKEVKKIGITDKEVAAVMADIANTVGVPGRSAPGRFTAMEALAEWAKSEKEDEFFFAAVKPWFTEKSSFYQVAACKLVAEFGEPAKKEFGKTLESLKLSSVKKVREAASEAYDKLSK